MFGTVVACAVVAGAVVAGGVAPSGLNSAASRHTQSQFWHARAHRRQRRPIPSPSVEFSEVIRRRRMVRNFDPDRPVPPQVRGRLLATALRAPSAGFSQGWGFLVLDDRDDRDTFWDVTTESGAEPDTWLTGLRRAPLLVVCFSHKDAYLDRYAEPDKGWTDRDEARWPVPYWDIDTGFAALLLLLAAVDERLGACFFGIPPQRIAAVRDAFGVPPAFSPIGVVAVGYPAPDRRSPSLRRGHRPTDQVVHYGRWSRSSAGG